MLASSFNISSRRIFTISCWTLISNNTNPGYILSIGRDLNDSSGGVASIAYGLSGISNKELFFEFGSGVGRVSSGIIPQVNMVSCMRHCRWHENLSLP
jgi:hypothetical protein